MDPYELPFGLLALFGWVLMAPIIGFWLQNRMTGLPIEVQFLATLTVPTLALLTLASWAQPG